MPVKKSVKTETSAKVKASAKKEAPIKASVKAKAKKRSSVDHVHIIERDFIIITSSAFLVIVMAMVLFI